MSRRAILDLALLGLLAATAAAVALPAGPVRLSLLLASASLVPGAAVLTRFEIEDPLIWAALAVALSLATAIAGGLALAWTGFWHPAALGLAVVLVSSMLLLADLRAPSRGRVSIRSKVPVDGRQTLVHHGLPGRMWVAQALVRHGPPRRMWVAEREVVQPPGPPLGGSPGRLRVTDHARYKHGLSASVPLRATAEQRPRASALGRLARLAPPLLPLVFGAVCWGLALHSLDDVKIGTQQVPAALPLTWWLSLTAVLGGAVVAARSGTRRWLVVVYVAMLALVLYDTLPAVLDVPQYAWTYKHIGVVRLIELRGSTSPGVDIYNRWPGFFSAAAVFSQLGGVSNPVSYAGWSEPFFALVDALMVAALGWSILRDRRIAGLAAVIFTAGNWVGQGYFSPQAIANPLALALLLLVTRQFTLGRVGPRTVRAIEWIVRRRQLPDWDQREAGGRGTSTRVAGALVLFLCAAIVVTHQLTPYFLLLQVGALALIGMLRPRWILPAMAVITIGYLIPNIKFVADWFGLFTSLDPFSNARAGASAGHPVAEPWIYQHAGQVLSLLFGVGAVAAWILLARRGLGVRAAPLIVLAAAPVLLLFGQSYGGEASLRVFLFSAPWDAILIAWATFELARRVSALPALAISTAVIALFVPAFLGPVSVNAIRPGEVAASEHFYAHAPAGSVLVLAAPNFPLRVGPRYALMYGSQNDLAPALLVEGRLSNQPLGAADVPAVVDFIRGYSAQKGFLVFSTSQYRYAASYGLSPPGALADLERAIARSPDFVLWHQAPDARIYRLVNPAHASASPPVCQDPAGAYNAGFNPGFNTRFNRGFNVGFLRGYTAGFGRSADGSLAPAQAVVPTSAFPPACEQVFHQGFNTGFDYGFNPGFKRGFNPGYKARHHG